MSNNALINSIIATGNDIMTAICVGRKGNLIEPIVTVYICERETEEITDHSQNQNLGTLKRRTKRKRKRTKKNRE